VVFLFRNFAGSGFELGVKTLNGVTRDNLNALNPAIMHYIGHLHVATAGFIAATGSAARRAERVTEALGERARHASIRRTARSRCLRRRGQLDD